MTRIDLLSNSERDLASVDSEAGAVHRLKNLCAATIGETFDDAFKNKVAECLLETKVVSEKTVFGMIKTIVPKLEIEEYKEFGCSVRKLYEFRIDMKKRKTDAGKAVAFVEKILSHAAPRDTLRGFLKSVLVLVLKEDCRGFPKVVKTALTGEVYDEAGLDEKLKDLMAAGAKLTS